MEFLGYLSLFFVGLVLGTLGGGGSILSVPILVYLFALDSVMASAYSLFIVGSTSLVGSIIKFRAQMVSIKIGFTFGIPSVLAIFSTRKWIVPSIPEIVWQVGPLTVSKRALILGFFAILMITASLLTITKQNQACHEPGKPKPIVSLILLGTFTGFMSGLVGAGGGFLIIPVLLYFTSLPFKKAVGTTLLIITSNSLMGFMGDVMNYALNWSFLFSITGLAILGICIGNFFTKNLSTSSLQKSFGWFILSLGSWILLQEVFCNS